MTAKSSPDTAAAPAESTVCVINKGSNTYTHLDVVLKPGEIKDIPKSAFDVLKTCNEFGVPVIHIAGGKSAADAQVALEDKSARLDAALARIAALEAQLGGPAPTPAPAPAPKPAKAAKAAPAGS